MELAITDTHAFADIQAAFNLAYPFLWINFFRLARPQVPTAKGEMIPANTTVRNIDRFAGTKTICIDADTSVAQLEHHFAETLHVAIKLLRKSGRVWVETSYTANWTLEAQNQEGEQLVY